MKAIRKAAFVPVVLLLVVMMMAVTGCKLDSATTNNPASTVIEFDKTGTLQGKIMNAVTGAPIGNDKDSDLKVWLIQGTDTRTPSRLETDNNNPLVGEYAFSGIPVDITPAGGGAPDTVFKLVVVKKGFQRFESLINITSLGMTNNSTGPQSGLVDTKYNFMGDVYLFPEGSAAGDVKVHVRAYGVPVPNAMVLLEQDIVNSNLTGTASISRLTPAAGLISSLSATTDASGIATFAGSKLVTGGAYQATALPMTFNGQNLGKAVSGSGAFFTDLSALDQYINMTATSGAALMAVSASNSVPTKADSTGTLKITFNQPVVLTTTWFNANATAGTASTPGAIGALSTDGLTLTITPNWLTAPTSTALGQAVAYSYSTVGGAGGTNQILIKSTQASGGTNLTSIMNVETGSALSGTVTLYNY